MKRLKISALVVIAVACLAYVGVCGYIYLNQRSLIFTPKKFTPTHDQKKQYTPPLESWTEAGEYFGGKREASSATRAWVYLHGASGQVAGVPKARLDKMEAEGSASIYVVEYPGYGLREGTPSRDAINDAVLKAYAAVVAKGFKQIGVIGESLGSGPASMLATAQRPPDKIVLLVPYDSIASLSQSSYPILSLVMPVRLLLTENWDNTAALRNYPGKVDIFAASDDRRIPNKHAKNLAASIKGVRYVEFVGGHGVSGKAPEVVYTFK